MTAPAPTPAALAAAARLLLARDGREHVLQPWQVAYLVALTDGRQGHVPPGCGVGKGWLDARLREALDRVVDDLPDSGAGAAVP
jgi:hypothetical protein